MCGKERRVPLAIYDQEYMDTGDAGMIGGQRRRLGRRVIGFRGEKDECFGKGLCLMEWGRY